MCARPKRAPFQASTGARVLERLLNNMDAYVSGTSICRELGLSRVAVWKHVQTLRDQGCRIAARRHCGYRLLAVPDLPTAEAVSPRLRTRMLGRPLLFFREVDSTNRQAAQRAAAGAPEGLAVVADHQTAGRGRMGRDWYSPTGVNLYLSLLLRPRTELVRVPTLPLAIGCGVARALAAVAAGVPVRIKWPNDLLVGGRKLGGILCEMEAEADGVRHVVVGVGINVNVRRRQLPSALAQKATSLAIETGKRFSRADVLAEVLNHIEDVYGVWREGGLAPLLAEIARLDALRGRQVRVEQARGVVAGRADGIQADGTLRILPADGAPIAVCSGDAHIT